MIASTYNDTASKKESCTDLADCDASVLIGADGIRSTVRKIILGEQDPAADPTNTGWWAIMTLQPYDKARASIGAASVDVEEAQEHSWIGDNVFLLHNILSHGQIVQFSVCTKDEDAKGTDQWQKSVSAAEVESTFTHHNHPPHLNKAVREVGRSNNYNVKVQKARADESYSCSATSRNSEPSTCGSTCPPAPISRGRLQSSVMLRMRPRHGRAPVAACASKTASSCQPCSDGRPHREKRWRR